MFRVVLFIIVLISILGMLDKNAGAQSLYDNKLVILTGEWPPYISQTYEGQGVVPRIIRDAFAHSGLDVSFKFVPWKTIYPNLEKGNFDGGAVWGDYQSWFGKLIASDPVIGADYVVFYQDRREFFDWRDTKSLRGMVMGYEKGGILDPYFQKLVDQKELRVRYIASVQSAFELLRNGQIDFMPFNKISGETILKGKYPDGDHGLTYHKDPFRISLYRVIFSDKPERARYLMEKLNHGLQLLRQTGEMAIILRDIGH